MTAGKLIAFEGLNGVGKTTLVRGVAEALALPRVATPPAAASAARAAFDEAPFSEAALLFYLSWVKHTSDRLAVGDPGPVVLCDRYVASTQAYFTAAGLPLARTLIAGLDIIPPALTVLVTADEPVRVERLGARDRRRAIDRATCDDDFRTVVLRVYRSHSPLCEVDSTRCSPRDLMDRTVEQIRGFL
ncbi:AAA family ATPase [Streptomyces sp. NPDC005820]|uniref:AAA family ATPase n=1 Tax=Streptomyces sp. NPDC005820 TaxID=3157069 RepID=UPI0034071637